MRSRSIAAADRSRGLHSLLKNVLQQGQEGTHGGVRPGERGDITIDITAAAARRLNSLRSADDPAYRVTIDHFLNTGEMRVDGDPSRMGGWLEAVHDLIVDRTI